MPTISQRQLQKALGVDAATMRRMIEKGLPTAKVGRVKRFDMEAVNAWLLEHGYAEHEATPPSAGQVCRTYAELARALGMTCRNPERIICRWAAQPGFPGRPGSGKGIADGFLPVDEIREWLANREGGRSPIGQQNDEEIRKLDRERRRLQIELEARKLQEQLGRLADVDEVSRFNRQCVANAIAILEPLADEIVLLLPGDTGDGVKAEVHRSVTQLLDNARLAIAEMIEGDRENREDSEEHE